MKFKKSTIKIIITLSLALFFISPSFCLAVNNVPTLKNPFDNMQIPIPGMDKFQEASIDVTAGTFKTTWIGEYIVGIYNFGIGIIGIIAMLAIAIGGTMWIISAGNPGRIKEAQAWIVSGLTGLGLGLGSYLILNLINGDLTDFRPLEISYMDNTVLDGINLAEDGSESEAQTAGAARNCVDQADIIALNSNTTGCDSFSAPNKKITKQLAAELKKVCALAHSKGIKIQITSAYRTMAQQTTLYNKAVIQHGASTASKWVARPTCNAPHVAGIAVDVSPIPKNNANIQLMHDIFKQAGWGRYCPEWWHFQPPYDKRGATC